MIFDMFFYTSFSGGLHINIYGNGVANENTTKES